MPKRQPSPRPKKRTGKRNARVSVAIKSVGQRVALERTAALMKLDLSTWARMKILEEIRYEKPESAPPEKPGQLTIRFSDHERAELERYMDRRGTSITDLVLGTLLPLTGWDAKDDPGFDPRWKRTATDV